MKKMLLIGVAALNMSAGTAALGQRLEIITGGHHRNADGQSLAYFGECKAGKVEMRIEYPKPRVQFFLGAARNHVDATNTTFGQTILTKSLAGKFAFACLEDTVTTVFWGVEVPPVGEIRPVTYNFILNFDGSIKADRGLQEADRKSVVFRLSGQVYRHLSSGQ